MKLAELILTGDRKALARAISLAENDDPLLQELMRVLYPKTRNAQIIGITGPPGVGKSTIVDKITKEFRKSGKKVGIIAIDPSSPFTGGAFLGDRVRMNDLNTDKGVFIRSMGTRGSLGGIARATDDVVKLLDAFGMDIVIVETVGAGQSEVGIMKLAHTSVIITMPGLGDEIQAIKAGLFEIGDIFVVNKADREGVERAIADLEMMLSNAPETKGWKPPIIKTIARDGVGIVELVKTIEFHTSYLQSSGSYQKLHLEKCKNELTEIIEKKLAKHILYELKNKGEFDKLVQNIVDRKIDPYSAAELVLEKLLEIKTMRT